MATLTVSTKRSSKRASVTATKTTSVNLDSVFLAGVERLLRNKSSSWTGSMTELETSLRKVVRRQNVSWPSNPRAMRATVDRLLPNLRKAGVKVRFGRTNDHNRKRFVEFGR